MTRSVFNPKPSDYSGRYSLGVGAIVIGIVFLIIGFASEAEPLVTLLASAGVALIIGGGATIVSASRSESRARKMKGE